MPGRQGTTNEPDILELLTKDDGQEAEEEGLRGTFEAGGSIDMDSKNAHDKREPLDDDRLLALVEAEINQASGYFGGELSEDRERAMEYYLGQARGDEIEGRSTVISMDVADVLEWILPQAIRAFTMNDALVSFDPVGEDDEEQAKLESDYVHHVFSKQEGAYEFLYSYIKDALLSKNGIAKTAWVNKNKRTTETYEQLTDDELMQLLEPDDDTTVEPLEHSEYEKMFPIDLIEPELAQEMRNIAQQAEMQGAPPEEVQQMMPPEEVPVTLHDLKLRRVNTRGCVTTMCVAPEQFLVSRDASSLSLKDSRFSSHKDFVIASDLVEGGVDIDLVDQLPGYSFDDTGERETRRFLEDEQDYYDDSLDMSTRKIQVYECYLRIDRDGDGIAELLKIRVAGPDSFELIDVEEVDSNPFSSITPFILTHKFFGLSIYDKIKQVQDQKTVLWRQILDNLYLQNNRRTIVVDGQVNLDDLLTTRPGGVVRAASTDSVMPLPIEPIGQDGYTMLEYLDKVRTERTGTSPEGTSQAFPVGADTAHGLERLMTMKEELVGLIIRTFAETGLKDIALLTREALVKHQSKAEMVKLAGTWVEVNPNEWRQRHNTTVAIVLGVGDRIRRQASAESVIAKQQTIVENGGMGVLTTESRIYNALRDYVRFGEMGTADDYFLDPESDEAAELAKARENEPDEPGDLEKAAAVTAKAEIEMATMKSEMEFLKSQFKTEEVQTKAQLDYLKQELSAAQNQENNQLQLTKLYEELTFKYDELEKSLNVDIPGKGTE